MSERIAPETMNLAEAATYLKLGREAMQTLFDSGAVPGASFNQKHTVFLKSSLDDFIRETARRQAEERRAGLRPTDRAAASPRGRANRRGLRPPMLENNKQIVVETSSKYPSN